MSAIIDKHRDEVAALCRRIGVRQLDLFWDASSAAERIARFTSGKTFRDYEADDYFRSAVERQFEIIGKASSQLSRVDPVTAAAIPELPRIVTFRNVLIHGYASVGNKLVWGVVETRLDPLRVTLEALLAVS